jgi:hypothetical protein
MHSFILSALVFILCIQLNGCAEQVPSQTTMQNEDQGAGMTSDLYIDFAIPFDAIGLDATDANDVSITACDNQWTLTNNQIHISCDANVMHFTPEVYVDGVWRSPSSCEDSPSGTIECEFVHGVLTIKHLDDVIEPTFTANKRLVFDGFRFRGQGTIEGVESWLSNGFQSWSQSGLIQIGAPYGSVATQTALSMQGDLEVVRSGKELSWWLSYAVAPISLITGTISASTFKTWIQMSQSNGMTECVITSGQTGDQINLQAQDTIEGERLWIRFSRDLNLGLVEYSGQLPHRTVRIARPEAGWNSWYELWDDISATDIIENARLLPGILDRLTQPAQRPYRIVIDDGWQQGWGQWTANPSFPNGMAAIAQQLSDEGFIPGIWLAPLLVSASAALVLDHPDWFLPEATFTHLGHGEMRIIDVTHPEAAQWLTESIRHLVSAGFTLLKIDFLFAGTYTSTRFEPMAAMQAYHRALSLIREAAGQDVVLMAVGAPPIAGFELIDSWRLGPDIAVELFDASWFFVPGTARATAARWPFCIHTLCDGDPTLLRNLSPTEIKAGSWVASLAGGAFFLSDDLRELDAEKSQLLTTQMVEQGLSGKPARPMNMTLSEVPPQLNSQILDQSLQRSNHQIPIEWLTHRETSIWMNLTDAPVVYVGETIPARTVIIP